MMQEFTVEKDGFIGAWYGGPAGSKKAIILMIGDSSTDHMAKCGAGWLVRNGCHALTMSAGKRTMVIIIIPWSDSEKQSAF